MVDPSELIRQGLEGTVAELAWKKREQELLAAISTAKTLLTSVADQRTIAEINMKSYKASYKQEVVLNTAQRELLLAIQNHWAFRFLPKSLKYSIKHALL